MANVTLFRRIQASIMDEDRPFHMDQWDYCIAGHCRTVLNELGTPLDFVQWLESPWRAAGDALGISIEESRYLFTDASFPPTCREAAVAKIDDLLARHAAAAIAQDAPLRGKAPSQSPRATLEYPWWITSMQVLQEARAEEAREEEPVDA